MTGALSNTTVITGTIQPAYPSAAWKRVTGFISFQAANIQAWGPLVYPGNIRGYNTPNLRTLNTLAGAKAFLDWQLPQIPKGQIPGFIFWCPAGDLGSIVSGWPADYATSMELAMPGFGLVMDTLTAMGYPVGIACRPAELLQGNAPNGFPTPADPTNPIHVLWLQNQIERCKRLFPKTAQIVWYCDSVINTPQSLGMLQHMRDFVGPDDLLLPECSMCSPAQMDALIKIGGGCYCELMNAAGDTHWQPAAQVKVLMKANPNAIWCCCDTPPGPFVSTSLLKRSQGFTPMVGDYPGGEALQ
jgi:hypothetical protein